MVQTQDMKDVKVILTNVLVRKFSNFNLKIHLLFKLLMIVQEIHKKV
jgi:hypothetical protein